MIDRGAVGKQATLVQAGVFAGIVVLAAVLRLVRLDLMEFKWDEVRAILDAKYWLGQGIPRYGMMSGVGVRNPPGFMFLLVPLAAVTSSPIAIVLVVALSNVAAVALVYRLGCLVDSRRAGAWAALFLAVHPWLLLYSRKVWAQSVLPLPVTLLLLVLARCISRPRSAAVFWLGPLVSLIWQVHYSGYCVLVLAGAWFLAEAARRRVNGRAAAAGFGLGGVMLVPYVLYLAGTGFADLRMILTVGDGGGGGGALAVVRMWGYTALAGGIGYPLAWSALPIARVLPGGAGVLAGTCASSGTLLMVLLVLSGVLCCCLGRCRPANGNMEARRWLVLFVVLPVGMYAIKGIATPPHYFIVTMPALMVLGGIGLRAWTDLADRARGPERPSRFVPAVAGGVVAGSAVVVWLLLASSIGEAGGTAGDYGLAYHVQMETACRLREEGVALEHIEAGSTRDRSIGVAYIMEHVLPGARRMRRSPLPERESTDLGVEAGTPIPAIPGAAVRKSRRARLIDTLLFPGVGCGEPGQAGTTRVRCGPMLICLWDE